MRATVKIRRGALVTAAAMACAAVGTPTPGVDFVDLIAGALPGARAESAYPFNPWALPVHPPVPGALPLPPTQPTDPPPSQPSDDPFPTPSGPAGIGPGGSALGIPSNVLGAYRRAADLMAARDPGCHLTWPVLAGIGRIESNHAYGGNLRADGTTVTRIIGIPLDGRPGVATIGDSDDGALDGDTVWDHAVGPMQFLPGTWEVFGQDGNGDGRRDPHNMYDAALAAAVYLCQGERDLRVESNLRAAIFAYNPSTAYVNAVLAWIRAYEQGGVPVEPSPTPGTSTPIGVSNPTAAPPAPPPPPTPKPTVSPTPQPPTDQLAPAPPTDLHVVSFTGTSVTLAWTAATDNVGVAAYDVYAGDRLVGATTRTSIIVASLTPDRSYTFTVRARDAANNSSQPSQVVTVVTDVTPPGQVGGIEITASSPDSVSLRWNPVTDNLGGEVRYLVYRNDQQEPIADTTATSYTDGTVTAATAYTYSIVAVDANGNRSTPTVVAVDADREAPTAPTDLSVEISGQSATLHWTAATDDVGVVGYEIEVMPATDSLTIPSDVSCEPADGDTASTCSASVGGLEAATSYEFVVYAVDAAGNRMASTSATAETAPSETTASPSPSETSSPDGGSSSDPSPSDTSPTSDPTSTTTADASQSAEPSTSPTADGEGGASVDTQSSTPAAREESTQPAPTVAPEPSDDPEPSSEPSSTEASASSDASSADASPTSESTPTAEPTPTSEPSPSDAPSSEESSSSEPSPDNEGTSASPAALVLESLSGGGSVLRMDSADELQAAYAALIEGGTVVSGPSLREPMEWKSVDADELWGSAETVWVARTDDVLVGLHPGDAPTIELQSGDQTLTVELTA